MGKKITSYFFVLLNIFFALSSVHGSQYLSVCAIFHNEAPYLKEWIEYHHMLGVEKFYLYNNRSEDDYKKVLKPYISKKLVELIEWPIPYERRQYYSDEAYNHCIDKNGKKTQWLAVIDVCDFIVPVIDSSIKNMIMRFQHAGGIKIWWQLFGTSNLYEIPENQTMIETLILKAPAKAECNHKYKSIVHTQRVKKYANGKPEYYYYWAPIFAHGTQSDDPSFYNIEVCRINRYWTRTERYFRQHKIPELEKTEDKVYPEDRIISIIENLNQEEDLTILPHVPKLRKKLGLKN